MSEVLTDSEETQILGEGGASTESFLMISVSPLVL